jgi:hypothetical protein
LSELERDVERWRHKATTTAALPLSTHPSVTSHTSQSSYHLGNDHVNGAGSKRTGHGVDKHGNGTGAGYETDTTDTTDAMETTDDDEHCELCEGPHQLDACPVFAGNTLGGDEEDEGRPSPLAGRGKRRCADCDVRFLVMSWRAELTGSQSTEHDTSDCPLAEDVF